VLGAVSLLGLVIFVLKMILNWSSVSRFFQRFFHQQAKLDVSSTVKDLLTRLSELSDPRDVYSFMVNYATETLGVLGCSLLLCDEKGAWYIKTQHNLKPLQFNLDDIRNFVSLISKRKNLLTKKELMTDDDWRACRCEALRYFVQLSCEACLPLYSQKKVIALLNFDSPLSGEFTAEWYELMQVIAVQFSQSLQNTFLYEKLARQNQALKQANILKNQLLSNVSHELRTPLNAIIGLSEMMIDGADGEMTEEQIAHLSLIRQSGIRLSDTLNALFNLSKLESHQLTLDIHRLDLHQIVSEVMPTLSLRKGIDLSIHLNPNTPGVYGDQEKIAQVFKHLLDNAMKFTKRGSVSVDAAKIGEMLRISVKDTGVGIPPEKRKKIFDGFVQGDGSETREFAGLGLGLTITKKIVELHGGRLWVSSKANRGSEFSFTLPLKPVGVRHPELSA